jgi:hypothetical protein
MTATKHGWWWFDFDDSEDGPPIDGRQPKHNFKERKGMKRILTLIASVALVAAGVARAQTGQVIVSQYNQWRVSGTVALAAGANTAIPFESCLVSGANSNFVAFTVGVPIKIVDPNNPSIDEVVSPSAVALSPGNCKVTFTTTNVHSIPYYITSGTAGLQEAVNASALSGAQNTALIDKSFYAFGGSAAIIHGATGSANLGLLDVTQAPIVAYRSTSGVYTANGNVGGASPTAVAGAAAGTSSIISNVGKGNTFTVSLTTGTATTTGTLYTETWPATGSFGYAPNVTVTATGPNIPPAFTYTVTGTSTHILTVTVASAPTASTAYTFQVSAQ